MVWRGLAKRKAADYSCRAPGLTAVTGGWSKWIAICRRSAGIKLGVGIIKTQSALINVYIMSNLTVPTVITRLPMGLPDDFFNRDAQLLARDLLGKVIRHRVGELWLSARIIETEAYYFEEKGSHASLGYTEKRKALFLDGGHIYMYYARGGDSLNFSAKGPGNAVLIKSAYPWVDELSGPASLAQMLLNNPDAQGRPRPSQKLCAGQTLLCKALGLKVPMWDAKRFDHEWMLVDDVGAEPAQIIQTTRLGIPTGRDEHLLYRFVDAAYAPYCTRNPLRRGQVEGRDYFLLS